MLDTSCLSRHVLGFPRFLLGFCLWLPQRPFVAPSPNSTCILGLLGALANQIEGALLLVFAWFLVRVRTNHEPNTNQIQEAFLSVLFGFCLVFDSCTNQPRSKNEPNTNQIERAFLLVFGKFLLGFWCLDSMHGRAICHNMPANVEELTLPGVADSGKRARRTKWGECDLRHMMPRPPPMR